MAVNPVQFLVASNASIADGSSVIIVSGNVDCSNVASGTAIFLGGSDNPAEGISGTSPDTSGNSIINLRNSWSQGTIINQQLISFNTNEGLATAIANVREIISNVSAIEGLVSEGLIKRVGDNSYELINITEAGESLITASDTSSQRGLLELGSASIVDVGESSGNVMEVGAFGLGSVGQSFSNISIDDITETSIGDCRGGGNSSATLGGNPFPNLAGAFGSLNIKSVNTTEGAFVQQIAISESPEIKFRASNSSGDYSNWLDIYHSGNTNFNEFGGSSGDDIAVGWVRSSNSVLVSLYINSPTDRPATSITVTGSFELRDLTGANTLAVITASDFSFVRPSNRHVLIFIQNLTGLTSGEQVVLTTASSSALITVNF